MDDKPNDTGPVTELDAEWCALASTPPIPTRALAPARGAVPIVIAPSRFIHQRGDDSILFSTATLRALLPERQYATPAAVVAVAERATPTSVVPVRIPAPKNVIEKWLWRLTAASVAMLVFFLAAVVGLVLIVPPPRPLTVATAPSARVLPPARGQLAPYLRRH